MNLVTIIWSMVASACLTLAAMNLLVWLKKRTAWPNLLFSLMAAATSASAFCELSMMTAETPGEFGTALRWLHVPGWVFIVALVGFVRLYLRAGRSWLAWTVVGTRTLSLVLNFVFTPNLNYREITDLRHIRFLGETISTAEGVSNPWMLVGQASFFLLAVYIADATLTVRRRGAQRKLLVLGSSLLAFIVLSAAQIVLALWGIVPTPITASFFFMGIVALIAYDMSHDMQRAAQLSDDLRESEERINLAADSAGAILWNLDMGSGRIWITKKAKEFLGFAPDSEISLEGFLNVVHPEDREGLRRTWEETMRSGQDSSTEYRVVLPDGSIRWVLARRRPYSAAIGPAARMMGVSIDITERKLAEAARLENMARYRAVVEAFDGFLYICSPDYRVEFMNQRLIERTGRNAVGEICYKALHNSDSVCEFCVNEKVFKGETVRWEVQSPKDHRWYYVVNTPIRHADGTMSKQSMIMDITERKLAEEELQKSEERILALVENTSDLIWSVDANTFGLLTFNAALRNYFSRGLGLEIHVGMTPEQMLPQEYAVQWHELYGRALREGAFVTEYLTSAETHVLLLSINCLKIRGEVFGISVFGRDITERKRAEVALKENEAALRNSKKDLQRLAGRLITAQEEELRRLSRELHDDLTQRLAVLAIEAGKLELDLNKMPEGNASAVHTVSQIKDQLIKVSEDVHTISRQLHPTILDDLGLVRAIESESAAFMRRNPIEINFRKKNVPDAIPDDIALCLYRVVQEGLKNIATHSGAKSCEIFLKGDDHAVCLSVTDGGIGFDPLAVRNMPGLGLSSMRERVQLVQGDFSIRSQPGKGTVVNVCVPLNGSDI